MKGSIFKKNNAWNYRVDIGIDPQTGQRKRKSKGGFRTKAEAQAALAEILNKVNSGTFIEETKMTVDKYLDYWIEAYCIGNLAPSTLKRYNELCNTIKKHLGKANLATLQPIEIQSFYNRLLDEGDLSAATILKVHRVFHTAYKHAYAWRLTSTIPTTAATPPRPVKSEFSVWDSEEATLFLDKIKEHNIYIAILLALQTGMRLGEILALKWDNVNILGKTLTVRNSLSLIKKEIIIKKPKTASSVRTIALMDTTVNELKKVRKKQLELKLSKGLEYEYVCLWDDDARHMLPDYVSKTFQKLIKKYNFKRIRFHDLRHTHATLLLQQGVHPKIVSERLGHSNISMTLDIYSHVLPNMQLEAVKKLENIFN
ncbi:site-specific integrase [Clostridium sp. 'White wine YQ']|uniref:site-specific integrase n=1 Tax=Clostridium sp. 'White wine YQ' TaxID=3027474 RepID=UPI002366EA57|nr:tyrosine-type recombinase/integrase [Clostridium sp. 'White wine YQ']MDD7793656.1 tyrosine-type recombinase/integrase [Clostridium sp. 'White wine YQ']